MNLTEKIENYHPSDEVTALIKRARIVLLVGIAGAGKDTIKRRLLAHYGEYRDIVSHTTRQPRINDGAMEVDGYDYHFVSPDEAEKMIDDTSFVEVKYVHGDTVYGTSAAEIQESCERGKISVTDIDIQGVEEYKELSREVTAVFILPPSYEVWRDRLARRYGSEESFRAELPKRRESAIRELERALALPYFHFVTNHDIDESASIVNKIAHNGNAFNDKDHAAHAVARELCDAIKQATD